MNQRKLRILSGQHAGSELPLNEGKLVIGSNEQLDDVVLTDEGITSSLLTLDITSDQILASTLESDTLQMGQRLIKHPEKEPLNENEVISVGPFQCVIGQTEKDLSEFHAMLNEDTQTKPRKKSSMMTSLVMVFILGGIPGSILTSLWFAPDPVDQQALTASESLQEVRRTARQMKLEDVRAQWNEHSHQVVLEGYVDSKKQQLELLKRIDMKGINYKSDIRTMTDIKEGVRFVLDNLGYHQIRVTDGDTAGTVLLTGAIDDSSRWNQVERVLESDVPGLVAWKVQLQKAGAYLDTLKSLLSKRQLLKHVQLVEIADRIEVRGQLTEPETSAFYDVVNEFRQTWGERPFVVLKSMPLVAKTESFSLPVRSISLGTVPYITLNDNIKYAVGSTLPSGHRIERISHSRVDLIKGDQQLSIQLGGQKHAALN